MSFLSIGKNLILYTLLFTLLGWSSVCIAQTHIVPLYEHTNKEVLNSIDSRAKELVSNNLNRFAIEKLKTYNFWLDSLYKKELQDTLAKIENAYLTKSAVRITTIKDYRSQISELSEQKEKLETRYGALAKKALLSFSLWLLIVLILLFFRKRKYKSSQLVLQSASTQLSSLEESTIKSNQILNDFKNVAEPIRKLNTEFDKLSTINSEANAIESDLTTKITKTKQAINNENKILTAVLSQFDIPNDEKVNTDINDICEQYLEIATRGFKKSEEFNYQVTRDFEKRIPSQKVNPAAVGTLLLNVLTNALQSLNVKNNQNIKGYQPKLAISTRILPRFLQIRIKDNGTGMSEDILKQSTKEFYSTRPLNECSGLGLYFASNIISEMHKGEIKIESEEGNSTDVYIKFFI